MSLKIGHLYGVEVRLHYTWFLIFAFLTWSLAWGYLPVGYPGQSDVFYWGVGAVSALMLFISVLIHEVAHSVVAQRYKIPVNSITLYFLGGVSEIAEEAHTPEAELRMAAAGPLTSIVLGVVFYAVFIFGGSLLPLAVVAVLEYAGYINIVLAAFNLIPAFPMDGGRVLRGVVWGRNKDILKSTRTVTNVSRFISYVFIAFGFLDTIFIGDFNGIWLLLIGLYVQSSAVASMNETRVTQALTGVTVGELMTKDVKTVEPDLTLQQLQDYALVPLKHHGFPVVKDGELLGIITDEDVRKVKPELWDEKHVRDIMRKTSELVSVKPEDAAVDALIKLAKAGIGRLPVIEGGKLVGIITRSDFAKAIQDRLKFRS
ncbi:MAG: site-2 protease family protein [Candidatus Bathyarchaeota archaeon]|nr:site-2 protease family protein [Candidatus Bathyarchaeota archaeon]